jgi:AraC-like DNA-binding protein
MRDHFVIHYVAKGRGSYSLVNANRTYHLKAGDSFFIFPNTPFYYEADEYEPWEYYWIGFHGQKGEKWVEMSGMSPQSPVQSCSHPKQLANTYFQLLSQANNDPASETNCLGLLIQLLSIYIRDHVLTDEFDSDLRTSVTDRYVQKAITFIHTNYAKKISISRIADHVSLERTYFSKIFNDKMNTTPYDFLISYRIEKAKRLLLHTDQSVQIIAGSVGFDDPSYFRKVFTKKTGLSPTELRRHYR